MSNRLEELPIEIYEKCIPLKYDKIMICSSKKFFNISNENLFRRIFNLYKLKIKRKNKIKKILLDQIKEYKYYKNFRKINLQL